MYLWPRTLEVPMMDPTKYIVPKTWRLQFSTLSFCAPVELIQFDLQSNAEACGNTPREDSESNETKKERSFGRI